MNAHVYIYTVKDVSTMHFVTMCRQHNILILLAVLIATTIP